MRTITELTLASYNIHKGVGSGWRRDLQRTAAVIAEIDADIIALQEADRRFGDRAGLLELVSLRRELDLINLPVPGSGPSHGWHGNVVLVRAGVFGDIHHVALPGFEARGAIITDLTVKGLDIRVIAAHFGLLPSSRRLQARAILDRLEELAPRPTVMLGDLNEWRTDDGSSLAHLMQHFRAAPVLRSFPARFPVLPLDRIFVSAGADLAEATVHDTPLARRASDHLPIKARLQLTAPDEAHA